MLNEFTIKTTKRCEFVDITHLVLEAVRRSGVRDGLVVVYCPHTTAGITINENADPSVVHDMDGKLSRLVEHRDPNYTHLEGNSDSHMKSSIIGASQTLIVRDGAPLLGTWQGVYFTEFDGPRRRKLYTKVVKG